MTINFIPIIALIVIENIIIISLDQLIIHLSYYIESLVIIAKFLIFMDSFIRIIIKESRFVITIKNNLCSCSNIAIMVKIDFKIITKMVVELKICFNSDL